jgi:DNA replicative helicase MCM subunit Mcm2 (Cdc46/Mcm family)
MLAPHERATPEKPMPLTRRSVEALIDLVEIKLSCMQVMDRDDAREVAILEQARRELVGLSQRPPASAAEVVPLAARRVPPGTVPA